MEVNMFKKILVPLDTSKLSEIALPYAEELAVKLGEEVILLHVGTLADSEDKSDHGTYLRRITTRTERKIEKSAALSSNAKVKVTLTLLGSPSIITNPPEEILDYAEKENVSLIVMATHGRTGIRRWALGSTTNKVAKAAKCPLLLIRASTAARRKIGLAKILVTLDGSRPSEAVLPYVEALALKFKSRISLLNIVEPLYHVYPYSETMGYYGSAGVVRMPYTEEEIKPTKDVAEKYIKDISDKLSSKGVPTSYKIRIGSPGEEIIKAEEEMHPHLIAMSTHGHSGFGRFENGSVADKVLHAGNTPLLLVRPQKP
jgi:nucleotide-binding universal stress UspA family protein